MKVVDSSVSLKWFVDEPRREGARALLESDDELIAPEFSYAEVANVLWRKVRIAQIAFEQADAAVGRLPALISLRSVSGPAMRTALGLAKQLDHSVYDCVFLAMALEFDDATFVTDDTRFAEKAVSAGFGERIRTLSDGPIRVVFSDAQLQSMLELFHRHRHVLDSVRDQVGRPFGATGLTIYSTGDLRPAFDSPLYVRLKKEISELSFGQASTLLAVAWLGRGIAARSFSDLFEQAAHLATDPGKHAPYIIGQLNHLERGIAKLDEQAARDD